VDQSQDSQLVLRLQDGDLEALGRLFDRHRQMVYRTALAITGDPEIAADLLQDVFLRLHRFAHRIDPQRPLKPWLYRVTVNISYTYLRRRRWLPVPIDDLLQQVGTSKASPERQVERREAREVVFSALTRLPPTQRVVVVLYYLNNLSLKDIAEILKCPVGTIKSRLFYSRENLRKILEGDEHATFDLAYDIR
jgi:RNA polymerase sigma-70 factor (ECF subfamily)